MRDLELDRTLGLGCLGCPLSCHTNPIKPQDPGSLFNKILLCAEAPGGEEEAAGLPFVGRAGRLLRNKLREEKINPDHIYITNTILCRPPNNRNPKASEIKACVPTLISKIKELNPQLIVACGNIALKTLTGQVGITRLNGKLIETKKSTDIDMVEGYPVMPMVHPAAILRQPRLLGEFITAVKRIPNILNGSIGQTLDLGSYTFLKDIENVRAAFRQILCAPAVAIDIETTSLDWADTKSIIKAIGFCIAEKSGYSMDLRIWTPEELNEIIDYIKRLFWDRRITKVLHNSKFDFDYLKLKFGIDVRPPIFDTKVAQFLCNELVSTGLKDMAWKWTRMGGYEKKYSTQKPEELEGDELLDYNCKDTDVTFRCYKALDKELVRENVREVFDNLLMPANFPLAGMEQRGIRINLERLEWVSNETNEVFDKIKSEMASHYAVKDFEKTSGLEFNPASTLHLRDVIYGKLKMPIPKHTPTGHPSVDKEAMDYLKDRDPLIRLVADYKEVQKIKTTYVEGIKKKIQNGRIHTRYLTWIARSGRTSSANINLQNLPHTKEDSVMERYNLGIRDMFIPDPNCEFNEADYDQAELRIMCIASNDQVMKYIFDNGLDIHEETAKTLFKVKKVSSEMRRQAKVINFGILYGMGATRLGYQLKIPQEEARRYIMEFFRKFWGVKKWKNRMEAFVREHGYIETLTGRKRRFPSIDGDLSAEDLRQALNTPIQGTASDILLYSLIGIEKMFKYYKMKSTLCAQVHDSILINVYKGERGTVRDICTSVMLKPPVDFKMCIPLAIDFSSGLSWGSLEKG